MGDVFLLTEDALGMLTGDVRVMFGKRVRIKNK